MGRTVSEIQRNVASYVGMPDDDDVRGTVFSGIQDTYEELNLDRWYFRLVTSGFGFQAGVVTYPAPTDYKSSVHLSYLNTAGESAGQFEKLTPKEFKLAQSHYAATVCPGYYTILNPYPSGSITLGTAPDANFVSSYPSGEIQYYGRLVPPTSENDQLGLPPEVEQWLMWTLRSQMAIIYATKDKMEYAQAKADIFHEQLRRNNRDDEDQDWS